MDDQEYSELSVAVALGVEAETFLGSDLGAFIMEESDREVERLRAEFEGLEPGDSDQMRKIHFKMKVAREALNWLGTAIQNGRQALRLIQSDTEPPE